LIIIEAERFGFLMNIVPAFRYNLVNRTPVHKDFHCNRG